MKDGVTVRWLDCGHVCEGWRQAGVDGGGKKEYTLRGVNGGRKEWKKEGTYDVK